MRLFKFIIPIVPWFIRVVSFLHYDKTGQCRKICQKLFACKQLVALFRSRQWWRGTYYRRSNWWKILTLCNLYIGSYHRLQLQQPPQALMYLFTFNGNFSHLASFSKMWSWWWIPLNYINKFISHTQTTKMSLNMYMYPQAWLFYLTPRVSHKRVPFPSWKDTL